MACHGTYGHGHEQTAYGRYARAWEACVYLEYKQNMGGLHMRFHPWLGTKTEKKISKIL
jgi:hypothetical protein